MNMNSLNTRHIWNSADFLSKKKKVNFGVKKTGSGICNFCIRIVVFINQSERSQSFLNSEIFRRRQYMTCSEISERSKCKSFPSKKYLVWFLCLMEYQFFLGNLMPKPFSRKNSSGTIQPIAGRIRGFIPFPRVFVRKRT